MKEWLYVAVNDAQHKRRAVLVAHEVLLRDES